MNTPPSGSPTVVIAGKRSQGQLMELWHSRELLRFLAWRDIKVRYKQTAFGAAWALIQPVIAMLIFTLVFGRFAKVPSEGAPYSVFAYCGLVPWTYFSVSAGTSANSLVEGQALITKVYFPRILIPASSVIANLVDFGIATALLVVLAALTGEPVRIAALAFPILASALVVATFAVGLLLSAVNVRYRDVRFALPFLIQIWLFATPVVYPSSILSDRWRIVFSLNPISGLIEGMRWSVLGTSFPALELSISLFGTAMLLVVGLRYFRRVEATFADVV